MSRNKKNTPADPPVVGTVVTRHAALFNQMEARITEDFNQKIECMQETILTSMAPLQQHAPEPPKGKGKQKKGRPTKKAVQVVEEEEEDMEASDSFEEPPRPVKRPITKSSQPTTDKQTTEPSRQTPIPTSMPHATTVNSQWDAWIPAQQPVRIQPANLPLSVSDLTTDDEDSLQRILTTTAHHLARGTQKSGFYVHKYVTRGREKRRTSLNMLSLPEYNWGLCMMIKDEKLPSHARPYIIQHLEEINEDAIDYDWPTAVRCWSEEVFTLVAENRLPGGWADTARIQMLRISMSKLITARRTDTDNIRDQSRELASRPRAPYTATSTETFKGGPPCPQYNSQIGCPLQSGHGGPNGRRYVHVCSYCLSQTAAVNHHSEVMCRNKVRQGYGNHF